MSQASERCARMRGTTASVLAHRIGLRCSVVSEAGQQHRQAREYHVVTERDEVVISVKSNVAYNFTLDRLDNVILLN